MKIKAKLDRLERRIPRKPNDRPWRLLETKDGGTTFVDPDTGEVFDASDLPRLEPVVVIDMSGD